MHHIPWLPPTGKPEFPKTINALNDPNGLLAFGGQLNTPWLLASYCRGIFPWFSEDEPIMWWSPSPRMVLLPGTAHISRSLRKFYKKSDIKITANSSFAHVIEQCSSSKMRSEGTWITEDMKAAYCQLHTDGWAHSVEVWQNDELIGGLYGVGIDKTFFGESMFSLTSNASKFAFIAISEWAAKAGLNMIDCQLYNPYLASLGAELIGRKTFENNLPKHINPLLLNYGVDLTQFLVQAFDEVRPIEI